MAISNPLKHMKSISPGRRAAPANPLCVYLCVCVLAFLISCQFTGNLLLYTRATSQVFSLCLIISSLSISDCLTFPGDNTSGACHSAQVHLQCKTLITKHSTAFLTRGQERPQDVTPIANTPPHPLHHRLRCSPQRGNDGSLIWRQVYVCITEIWHLPLSISVKAWARI